MSFLCFKRYDNIIKKQYGSVKLGTMKTEDGPQSDDYVSLYHRAFEEYGTRALWNIRKLEDPNPKDALVIARYLRLEGNLAARRLAEQIEKVCHATH